LVVASWSSFWLCGELLELALVASARSEVSARPRAVAQSERVDEVRFLTVDWV
jgi:hypothetical protein